MTHLPSPAALLGLHFGALGVRTLRPRRRLPIGDAGNAAMLRAVRVRANFADRVPTTLRLPHPVATTGGSAFVMHRARCCPRVGRLVHTVGVAQVRGRIASRITGLLPRLGGPRQPHRRAGTARRRQPLVDLPARPDTNRPTATRPDTNRPIAA